MKQKRATSRESSIVHSQKKIEFQGELQDINSDSEADNNTPRNEEGVSNKISSELSAWASYSGSKAIMSRRRNKIGSEVIGLCRPQNEKQHKRDKNGRSFTTKVIGDKQKPSLITQFKNSGLGNSYGFYSANNFLGDEEKEGIFNCEAQFRTLKEQICEEPVVAPKKTSIGQVSVLNRMRDYIKASTSLQKKFMEEMVEGNNDLKYQSRTREVPIELVEEVDQEMIKNLNNHINFIKQKNTIEQQEREQMATINNYIKIEPLPKESDEDEEEHQSDEKFKRGKQKELDFIQPKEINVVQQNQGIDSSIINTKRIVVEKIDEIKQTHKQIVKDTEYVYSELTQQLKKDELLKKITRLSQQKAQLLKQLEDNKKFQRVDSNYPQKELPQLRQKKKTIILHTMLSTNSDKFSKLKAPNPTIQQQQLTGDLKKDSKMKLLYHKYKGFFKEKTNGLSGNKFSNPPIMSSTADTIHHIEKESSSTSLDFVCQQLEASKKALGELQNKSDSDCKVYFQPKYKLREKRLSFELGNSDKKEAVLDMMMMSFFHQQDLLNEQKILLDQNRKKKGIYQDSDFTSYLNMFQPSHLRLEMKDIARRASSGNSVMSQRHRRKVSLDEKASIFESMQKNSYEDEKAGGYDVEFYRENMNLKRIQQKKINFTKLCSPNQMVLAFKQRDPKFRKQESIEAIDFLVQFNPEQEIEPPQRVKNSQSEFLSDSGHEEKEIEIKEVYNTKTANRIQEEILRRCFFKFSNKNDILNSERFKFIDFQNFMELFKVIEVVKNINKLLVKYNEIQNMQQSYQQPKQQQSLIDENLRNEDLTEEINDNDRQDIDFIQIFNKVTKKSITNPHSDKMDYFQFQEALNKVVVAYYIKKIALNSLSSPLQLYQNFYQERIAPYHLQFRDDLEKILILMRKNKHINDLLLYFEKCLEPLFVMAGSFRSTSLVDVSQIFLQFQELFEILQKLQLFPTKVSKTTIRYLYCYVLDLDIGLDFSRFCTYFHLLALNSIRNPQNALKQKIDLVAIKRQCRQIQLTIYKLSQEHSPTKTMTEFIQDISIFYIDKQFLDITNMQERIASIKSSTKNS